MQEIIKVVVDAVEKQRQLLASAYDTCPLEEVGGIRRARRELGGLKNELEKIMKRWLDDPFADEEDRSGR